MIIDGLGFWHISKELNEELYGFKFQKIKALDNNAFIFSFYNKEVKEILLDLNYGLQSIFLIEGNHNIEKKEISPNTQNFVKCVKNILENDYIEKIYTVDFDRIIVIKFGFKKIIIELMGKNSNIVLVDEDDRIKIALKLKRKERQKGRGNILNLSPETLFNQNRIIDTGAIYQYPKNPKPVTDSNGIIDFKNSRLFSKISTKLALKSGFNTLENFLNMNKPCLYNLDSQSNNIFPDYIEISDYAIKKFNSYSELFNSFYFIEKEKTSKSAALENYLKKLNSEKDFYIKKLESLEKVEKIQQLAFEYKSNGDFLKSNIYRVESSQKNLEEFDGIKLKPNLTFTENIERFYSLYKKESKRFQITQERKKAFEYKINQIDNKISEVENSQEIPEKNIIEEKKQSREKIFGTVLITYFKDTRIYVGKSAKDNDFLLSKVAKGNYLWLHAQNLHGGHIIVERDYRQIPPDLLAKAAWYAAINSEGKKGGSIPVDYTACKYVKKIKKVLGKVIFTNNRTIFVKI
ncbi:MAG: NFACT RNA binding domain-containing protein [Candidatus Muiribacteriota bacterium]